MKSGSLEKIGEVEQLANFDGNVQLFPELALQAIGQPFAEFETAAGKFRKSMVVPPFLREQNFVPVVQENAVNPQVELLHFSRMAAMSGRKYKADFSTFPSSR